ICDEHPGNMWATDRSSLGERKHFILIDGNARRIEVGADLLNACLPRGVHPGEFVLEGFRARIDEVSENVRLQPIDLRAQLDARDYFDAEPQARVDCLRDSAGR